MSIEQKLQEMGLELPVVAKPLASYVPAVVTEGYVYTSGQVPILKGEIKYKGKVGQDVDEAQGYEAAKLCVLNCLAAVKSVAGSLDNVEKIVKVVGFVNSVPGFTMQPKIINGASDLLGQLFGEKGEHARSAVGVSELPLNAACEVEIIVKIK